MSGRGSSTSSPSAAIFSHSTQAQGVLALMSCGLSRTRRYSSSSSCILPHDYVLLMSRASVFKDSIRATMPVYVHRFRFTPPLLDNLYVQSRSPFTYPIIFSKQTPLDILRFFQAEQDYSGRCRSKSSHNEAEVLVVRFSQYCASRLWSARGRPRAYTSEASILYSE